MCGLAPQRRISDCGGSGKASTRDATTRLHGGRHPRYCLPIGAAEVNASSRWFARAPPCGAADRTPPLVRKPGGSRIALLTDCGIADSRHGSAGFLVEGRPTGQTSSTKRFEFKDAKNIAPADRSVGKERFFTSEDFATGFVGITSVNSNRGLLGSKSVLQSSRDAADGRVHTITSRIGRCTSGILPETKAYKNIPAELLGEGDLYASHSAVLVALAHTR
jgi:hypothetical protein